MCTYFGIELVRRIYLKSTTSLLVFVPNTTIAFDSKAPLCLFPFALLNSSSRPYAATLQHHIQQSEPNPARAPSCCEGRGGGQAKPKRNTARATHPPGGRSQGRASNGQQHRRPAQGRQGHAAGRHGVPRQAAGVRGHRAARPPGVPAPRVRGGEAPGRPRAPARARRAAPPRTALLPRRAAPAGRPAAPRVVRRAPRRRAGAARVAHAHAPVHLRPLPPGVRRHGAGVSALHCLRGRARPAPDAPAQGPGREAHGREPGWRRGRRQDHADVRRQRWQRRRHAGEGDTADARAEPAVRAHAGLGRRRRRRVPADAGAEPEVRGDARLGDWVHVAGWRGDGAEDAGEVARAAPHAGVRVAGRQGQPEREANAVRGAAGRDHRVTSSSPTKQQRWSSVQWLLTMRHGDHGGDS